MRTSAILIGTATLLFWAALGSGAPLDTKARARVIELEPFAEREFWGKFPGGRRTLAIAVGSSRKLRANLGLYVFDPYGNCVARDDDLNLLSRDDLAVEWLPAQTSLFSIQVKSLARVTSRVLLAVRQL